jgi:hypothetical protein
MADGKFYVVGGEYADSNFTDIVGGQMEQRHGPYCDSEARDVWRALTGKTVDNALIRYRIKPESEILGTVWYVAGGEYADTGFCRLIEGMTLQTHGPYSRAEALTVWRSLTGKTVDNAMIRYNIVTADGLETLKRQA